MINRWDICLVICDLLNEPGVYRCYRPVLPGRSHSTSENLHILAFACSALWEEQKNSKNGGCHVYSIRPLCCVYKKWHNVFVLCRIVNFSVFSQARSSLRGPVLWTQAEPGSPPPKKRPRKGETQDLICQSSKGTQSERWIYDLSVQIQSDSLRLRPVCFRHEKVLEHARQYRVCVNVCVVTIENILTF